MADNSTAQATNKTTESQRAPEYHSSQATRWIWTAVFLLTALLTVNVWLISTQLQNIVTNSREHAFWAVSHSGTTSEMRARYLLQLIADGNTEWRSANLSKMEMNGVNLSGAGLAEVSLSSGTFRNADFTKTNLNNAVLDLCDFSEASFSKANLRNATFFKSRLADADFRNADMLSASLEQCVADGANFVAAEMGDAFCPMADFSDADLTGADLSGANLNAAILNGANLALANFYGASLTDTDFTDTNWWRSRGLTSAQMDDFALLFSPTSNAPEARQRDFELWLGKRIDEHQAADEE